MVILSVECSTMPCPQTAQSWQSHASSCSCGFCESLCAQLPPNAISVISQGHIPRPPKKTYVAIRKTIIFPLCWLLRICGILPYINDFKSFRKLVPALRPLASMEFLQTTKKCNVLRNPVGPSQGKSRQAIDSVYLSS